MNIENIRIELKDREKAKMELERLPHGRLAELLVEAWGQLEWLANDIPEANRLLGGKP